MAKFALLLAAAAAGMGAIPAYPAVQKEAPAAPPIPVTVQQFEQFLSAPKHPRDSKFAGQLAGFELTERAGSASLARWLEQVPGRRSRQALIALADFSAFKDLPAADLPRDPSPDLETQREIFSRIVDYVVRTRPKLPDFSALRSTTRFEVGTPGEIIQEEHATRLFSLGSERAAYKALGRTRAGPSGGQWLFFAATSSRLVTYRDGREVSATGAGVDWLPISAGLSTSGEFGPILGVVVGDATHGRVAWRHWEPGKGKPLAVFSYSVPGAASHYAVSDSQNGMSESAAFPAYHGEIAVDPDTGAILRISLFAEVNPANKSETGIVVEFGPVNIGGKTYICPIHSIALSRAIPGQHGGDAHGQEHTFLNDVTFTDYHIFRTEMRIVPESGGGH